MRSVFVNHHSHACAPNGTIVQQAMMERCSQSLVSLSLYFGVFPTSPFSFLLQPDLYNCALGQITTTMLHEFLQGGHPAGGAVLAVGHPGVPGGWAR